MPTEKYIEPEFETILEGVRVEFWYNSKTHKYSITSEDKELPLEVSKAKAEAIIAFLKWFEL